MLNYCAQHKCRPEDMVRLARTYMGPDVQAYLDAKYKGTLPDDWDEVEKTLRTSQFQESLYCKALLKNLIGS